MDSSLTDIKPSSGHSGRELRYAVAYHQHSRAHKKAPVNLDGYHASQAHRGKSARSGKFYPNRPDSSVVAKLSFWKNLTQEQTHSGKTRKTPKTVLSTAAVGCCVYEKFSRENCVDGRN